MKHDILTSDAITCVKTFLYHIACKKQLIHYFLYVCLFKIPNFNVVSYRAKIQMYCQ